VTGSHCFNVTEGETYLPLDGLFRIHTYMYLVHDNVHALPCFVEVTVERRTLNKGQRDWSRKHTCFLCSKSICDLPRHLEKKHKDNCLVQEALSKPKKSKERLQCWRIMSNKGAFKHNIKARDVGGELQVKRRIANKKPDEYSPCPHCYGYYLKKDLWRHTKKCKTSTFGASGCQSSISKISAIMESASVSSTYSKTLLENLFCNMKRDEVFMAVKSDTLARLYAMSLLEEGRKAGDVSWTIRLIGKLLLKIRELSGQEELSWIKLVDCSEWSKVIKGVKSLAEFEYQDGLSVGKPNIGIKCGQGIKGLLASAQGHALKTHDDGLLEKTRRMFELYDHEWAKIARHCHVENKCNKEEKLELLPLAEDVTKLRDFCILQTESVVQGKECDVEDYTSLSKITLTRLITFNARRGGEPGKLRVSEWPKIRNDELVHKEEIEKLPEEEKLLAKRLKLGFVLGKGSKKVPILFPPETVKAIDFLLIQREKMISNAKNPFIFARLHKSSTKLMRGPDCVREVCAKAGLERPDLITATQMRKYLSTTLQLIDMTEAELRWVTDHLGHTIDVHKKWYRLSNRTVELTKVAAVLVAAESGYLQNAHSVPFDQLLNAGKYKFYFILWDHSDLKFTWETECNIV
jgi:hypothetical protein